MLGLASVHILRNKWFSEGIPLKDLVQPYIEPMTSFFEYRLDLYSPLPEVTTFIHCDLLVRLPRDLQLVTITAANSCLF